MMIELMRAARDLAVCVAAIMRVNRVIYLVRPDIGVRIGIRRSAEERETENVPVARMTVLAVVYQRRSMSAVGEIGELVRADL